MIATDIQIGVHLKAASQRARAERLMRLTGNVADIALYIDYQV
jgi:hypothetical protein